MVKDTISEFATKKNHNEDGLVRHRCGFCDKLLKTNKRKEDHERSCAYTCFNFLYKVINGKIIENPLQKVAYYSVDINICF